jgi:hypothetical protein
VSRALSMWTGCSLVDSERIVASGRSLHNDCYRQLRTTFRAGKVSFVEFNGIIPWTGVQSPAKTPLQLEQQSLNAEIARVACCLSDDTGYRQETPPISGRRTHGARRVLSLPTVTLPAVTGKSFSFENVAFPLCGSYERSA